MKLTSKKFNQEIAKFQEGGEMPAGAPTEAPADTQPTEEQDPLMQIVQAAAQAVQNQDAQLALQVCQALVEMAGGGQQAPEQAPVFAKGGRLVKFIKK